MPTNKTAVQQPNAVAKAGAETLAQAKAKGLVWVPGYGYKGLTGTKATMAKYGLNYSQWYLAYMAAAMPASERVANATAAQVAAMRTGQGQSWGYIMARTGYSEGMVRKLFTQVTGTRTEGLRNGRGGRMVTVEGKPATKLYVGGNRKALGSEVPAGTALAKAKPTTTHKVAKAAPAPVAKARKPKATK